MQDIMQNEFVIKNRLFFLFTTISYLGYFHVNSLILGVEEGGIVILLIKLHIYLFNNIWNEKKNNFTWAPTLCLELYKALELQRWVREEFFPKELVKEQVADTDTEKQAKRKRSNLRQLGLLEGLPKGENMWPGLKGWVEFSQGRRVLELLGGMQRMHRGPEGGGGNVTAGGFLWLENYPSGETLERVGWPSGEPACRVLWSLLVRNKELLWISLKTGWSCLCFRIIWTKQRQGRDMC